MMTSCGQVTERLILSRQRRRRSKRLNVGTTMETIRVERSWSQLGWPMHVVETIGESAAAAATDSREPVRPVRG